MGNFAKRLTNVINRWELKKNYIFFSMNFNIFTVWRNLAQEGSIFFFSFIWTFRTSNTYAAQPRPTKYLASRRYHNWRINCEKRSIECVWPSVTRKCKLNSKRKSRANLVDGGYVRFMTQTRKSNHIRNSPSLSKAPVL